MFRGPRTELTRGKERLTSTLSHSKAVRLSSAKVILPSPRLLSPSLQSTWGNVWSQSFWTNTTGGGEFYWHLVSGSQPGMLLNILRCPWQPPTKNYSVQNVNSSKVEKSCSKAHTLIEQTVRQLHIIFTGVSPYFYTCIYSWISMN